jgi:hypothetical protein
MIFDAVIRPDKTYRFIISFGFILPALLTTLLSSVLQSLPSFILLSKSTIRPSKLTSSNFLKGILPLPSLFSNLFSLLADLLNFLIRNKSGSSSIRLSNLPGLEHSIYLLRSSSVLVSYVQDFSLVAVSRLETVLFFRVSSAMISAFFTASPSFLFLICAYWSKYSLK